MARLLLVCLDFVLGQCSVQAHPRIGHIREYAPPPPLRDRSCMFLVFISAGCDLLQIHSFFFGYKNIFYKNIEAEICEILRIF